MSLQWPRPTPRIHQQPLIFECVIAGRSPAGDSQSLWKTNPSFSIANPSPLNSKPEPTGGAPAANLQPNPFATAATRARDLRRPNLNSPKRPRSGFATASTPATSPSATAVIPSCPRERRPAPSPGRAAYTALAMPRRRFGADAGRNWETKTAPCPNSRLTLLELLIRRARRRVDSQAAGERRRVKSRPLRLAEFRHEPKGFKRPGQILGQHRSLKVVS